MEKKQSRNIKLMIAAILVSLPFTILIKHNYIQSFNDFFIPDTHKALSALYSWSSYNFGYNQINQLWRLFPLGVLYFIFNQLLRIPTHITQFFFLTGLYLTGFFSFYTLTRKTLKLHNNSWPALIGAAFFVFNTYTLTQLTNSYLLIIPYMLLPLQIGLMIKGLERKQILRYAILSALLNAGVFGVNLVFDFISVFLLISYGAWIVFIEKKVLLKSLVKFLSLMILFTVAFTAWWAGPMIVSSIADKATTKYVLTSESFYNLDSSVSKVLRGLGDWGFFSGQKGLPYNSFASNYKNNPFILAAGFLITAIFLSTYALERRRVHSRLALYFTIIIILLLPFIGGTNPSWPTHSLLTWLFNHVQYLTIFRNTYKWMSLVMLSGAILLVIFLHSLERHKTTIRYHKNTYPIIAVGVTILIVLNAWPYFVGQVFSSRSEIDALPNYWNQAAAQINRSLPSAGSRILLLPNQYFPVFQWPMGVKSFYSSLEATIFDPPVVNNTCIGCSQYHTDLLLRYIYKNLSQPNIFKLAGELGLSHVLERNDYNSAYYDVETPSQIKAIMSATQDAALTKNFGKLDLYTIDSKLVSSRITSPNRIIGIDQLSDSLGVFNDFNTSGRKTNLFLTTDKLPRDKNTLENSNYYHGLFSSEKAKVELDQITESLSIQAGEYNVFQKKPFESLQNRAFSVDKSGKKQSLSNTSIKSEGGEVTIGTSLIREKGNLLPNGSFEQGLWQAKVGDCQLADPRANISMKIINDHTVGQKALELRAEADNACTYSSAIVNFVTSKDYVLGLDYKIIKGQKAGFCIWDGQSCIRTQDLTQADNKWHHIEAVVEPQMTSKQLTVFLYAPSTPDMPATVRYDNVSVQALKEKVLSAYAIKTAQEKLIQPARLSFTQVNPTLYRIQDHQTSKSLITFQESYHPSWRAFVLPAGAKAQAWWKTMLMIKPGWEVPAQNHIIINSFANGWWVDPAKMPPSLKSSNGDYTLILEYWPQRLVYFGGLISGLTLLGCLGYLAYDWRKRRRGRGV